MKTIHAPEMRSTTERCITTSTGIAIGRCHVRKPPARVAGSVSGPHRRPGIAARVLGVMGSMRALFVCIAICAAALLLSACGPTDTEALQDVALDLQDAQAAAVVAAASRK
jgi:hypothetical protein